MSKIIYYFVVITANILALLPSFLRIPLKKLIYFLLYYLLQYRRDVVSDNLKVSFPTFNQAKLTALSKAFYSNLSDSLLNGVKAFSFKKVSPPKHKFENSGLIENIVNQKESYVLVSGHFFHWEDILQLGELATLSKTVILYQPLHNTYLDQAIRKIRSNDKVFLKTAKELIRFMNGNKDPFCLVLLADQNPSNDNNIYWSEFLSQDSAFMDLPVRIACRNDMHVVYADVSRSDQAYTIEYKEISKGKCNQNTNKEELVSKYVELLELNIKREPSNWLWSHKRWKMKRN